VPLAPDLAQQLDALDRGVGVLDLEGWRIVRAVGGDAEPWLNDLVTADVAALPAGGSVRCLLLGPTGRIRADLLVHRRQSDLDLVLLQPPGQPSPIDALLEPYVLSADVAMRGVEGGLAVLPAPGTGWAVAAEPPPGAVPVGAAAFETWRIEHGIPRFPIDLDEDSLPAEAGLDEAPVVDRDKGCYLGQESVAKVRNLGHPARVVVAVWAERPVSVGRPVLAGSGAVGVLTSVDPAGDGRNAIARIRWDARDSSLATEDGVALVRR
jgi:folate-binding protein YgfZ